MRATVPAPPGERRNVAILRVLRLRKRLDGLRYAPSIESLAQEFGVCERTIRRDLAVLEEAHEHVPAWRMNEEIS